MKGKTPDFWESLWDAVGGLLRSPGPDRLAGRLAANVGRLVLVLGLAFFILAQGWVTVYPLFEKKVPTEADDAFAYITKAVQMKECFFQDCPALLDLRAQTEDRESDILPFMQFQIFSKTLFIYHPLHSAVLVGLNGMGVSWEGAYKAVWIAGFLMTAAAAALLLTVLFGPGGAGMALFILPFFRIDGFDFMVPTHMVTTLAMALWAAVLARVRGLPYLIVIGTLILLPLHMIGPLQVLVLLALYWITASRPLGRGRIVATAISLALVAAHFSLPLVLDRPSMSVSSFTQAWRGPLTLFPDNVRIVVTHLTQFVESHGGYLICGLLMGLGAAFNTPLRRRRAVLVLWICLGLVAASFLPRAPIPGNAFHRIQTPFLILLCGLMGRAGWVWIRDGLAWLWNRLARTGEASARFEPFLFKGPLGLAGLVLVGFVLFRLIVFGAMDFRASAGPVVERNISHKNFFFEPGQVQLLTELAGPGETVFYHNLIPMQYYLNHGALGYGAVLKVLLSRDDGERRSWLKKHEPGFVVTGSPWWGLSDGRPFKDRPIYQWGGAFVPRDSALKVVLAKPVPLAELALRVDGSEARGRMGLTAADGSWYALTGSVEGPGLLRPKGPQGASVSEFILGANGPFLLQGLILDHDQKTRWPWDKGAVITTQPAGSGVEPVTIRFESASFNPLPKRRMEVLDDRGSSVLFRLRP